jgi:hypothetical protein
MVCQIMSILKIIKIVFRQLLKPAAGRLPNQQEGQILNSCGKIFNSCARFLTRVAKSLTRVAIFLTRPRYF